jgi:hypothetical protein
MSINMRWFEVLITVLMIQIFWDLTLWWSVNRLTIYQLCTRWHSITPQRTSIFYFLSVLFNAVVFSEDQSTGDGWMNEWMCMEHRWNDKDIQKSSTWKKTHPSATLAITTPTWIDLELNWGLCGDWLETLCPFLVCFLMMLSSAQASYQ